jgi:lambda family phage portal protein
MKLPALNRVPTLVRQLWSDLWWGGGPQGSSTAVWAWDASKAGTRLSKWWPVPSNFVTSLNPILLKNRARDSYRNNAWARRAVDLMVAYVVSTGITPLLNTTDTALRGRVQNLWRAWTEQSDFTGRASFYGQQADIFRACLIDGEALALIRPGENLQIQILASEFLDYSLDNAVDILNGIKYDGEGRREGYFVYEKLPAEPLNPISQLIPADRVCHLYAPLQPGFERGSSWLAPALLPLYELQGYMEASLVRARTGSLFAGFVRSADGTPFLTNPEGETSFEPGSIVRLRPGDEMQFSNPPDPTSGYQAFVSTQLHAISASLGLPYEYCSTDLSQITFASGRSGLLAFERTAEPIVQMVAYQFCRPIWNWWTRIMVAAAELPESVLETPVRWVGVPIKTLDSRMEVQSTVQAIRAGLMSRAEAVNGTGVDITSLDLEIAADNQRADRLGLIFDSDARKVTAQGQEQSGVSFDATPQTP